MEESISNQEKTAAGMTPPRMVGWLVLFSFFLSGAVGLIYEIVWARLLRLVMGNTVFSITTVLCAFMGGLALGGFWGGKIVDRRDDPLRIYAFLEGAIGIYSLLLPGIIKATEIFYQLIYQEFHTSFYLFSLIRFLFCCLLLLLPTTLMGATLPVLIKSFVSSSDRIGWTVGKLYAVNTFGAVLGSFSAGFLLIPALGVNRTITIGAIINLFIFFLIYPLHTRTSTCLKKIPKVTLEIDEGEKRPPQSPSAAESESFHCNLLKVVLIGYGLSGFSALVYEIAWTRILTLIIGSSIYAFSLMLTAFIFGLALGSMLIYRFIDRRRDLVLFLAAVEVMIGFSALLVMPLFDRLPLFIVDIILKFSHSFWLLQLAEFGVVFLLMLIPTTMMGAAFPLASRIYTRNFTSVGSSVGSIYAVNTLGSILGAFIGAFILIPWLGIQKTILMAVMINLLVGCSFLIISQTLTMPKKVTMATLPIVVAVVIALFLPAWSIELISSGSYVNTIEYSKIAGSREVLEREIKKLKVIYHKEGISTTVTVKENAQGDRFFLVNGKGDASSSEDLPTQELLAHVPLLLHHHPQSVLVIGLASGVTLGSSGLYPIKKLDCVEISPEAVEASHYFDHVNYNILKDPRVELIIEDGRNHLALTNRKYDVIISEPSNPWIAGISDLFTREFFQLCRDRVNIGGVVCVWLHAYNIEDGTFRSIIHTFQTVFPYLTIWESSVGVDYLLIGSGERIALDYGRLLKEFQNEGIGNDLKRINIKNAVDFLGHFVMDEAGVGAYLQSKEVRIHTDDNVLVEFSAPRALYRIDTREPLMEALNRFRDNRLSFLTYAGEDEERLKEVKALVVRQIEAKRHITNGNIYLTKGNGIEAIAEFEKAVNLRPEELSTMEKYVEFLADVYLGGGRYDQAISVLEKALAIRPDNSKAMVTLGALYVSQNEHQKAEQLLQKALSIDKRCAEAYLQLGYLYLVKKELPSALSSFNQLLQLQPENPQGYLYLGETYQALGEIKSAISAWQKSIDLQPTLAIAHLNLGNAYFEMGDFQDAEKEWQKALAGKAIDISTHLLNLGLLYFQSAKYDKAIYAWQKAGELKGDDPSHNFQIHYNSALAYYQKGQYEEAYSELKEGLRLEPGNQSALFLLERIRALRDE
ncbi:MAG: fused MFS/spermidine synthase [bacterium]